MDRTNGHAKGYGGAVKRMSRISRTRRPRRGLDTMIKLVTLIQCHISVNIPQPGPDNPATQL